MTSYNFPSTWYQIKLIDILLSLESGSRPTGGATTNNNGIPSIGGEHLNSRGKFNWSSTKYIPENYASQMVAGKIQTEDILIVKDGATTAKTSYIDKSFAFKRAYVNEHIFICRTSVLVNSKFIFWYLWSEIGKEAILENFSGHAQGGINKGFANNVVIPIPPISEQNDITEKLDTIFIELEEIRKKLELIPDYLSKFRAVVLKKAISGELTEEWRSDKLNTTININMSFKPNDKYRKLSEIPESWQWASIGDTSECERGRFSARPRNDPRYFGRLLAKLCQV